MSSVFLRSVTYIHHHSCFSCRNSNEKEVKKVKLASVEQDNNIQIGTYLWEIRCMHNMTFFRLRIQDRIPTLNVGLQSVPLGLVFGIPSTSVVLRSVTVFIFTETKARSIKKLFKQLFPVLRVKAFVAREDRFVGLLWMT